MTDQITIRGARLHNLKNITLSIPKRQLVVLTGLSGSGKSTLVFDILNRLVRQRLYGVGDNPGEHDSVEGIEHIVQIITIDQRPIGRLPGSNAATYTDVFTPIRHTFAATPEARRLGLSARHDTLRR